MPCRNGNFDDLYCHEDFRLENANSFRGLLRMSDFSSNYKIIQSKDKLFKKESFCYSN